MGAMHAACAHMHAMSMPPRCPICAAACCKSTDPHSHCTLQVLEFEAQHLEALPSGQMYEKSYMHRDTVTHVMVRMDCVADCFSKSACVTVCGAVPLLHVRAGLHGVCDNT